MEWGERGRGWGDGAGRGGRGGVLGGIAVVYTEPPVYRAAPSRLFVWQGVGLRPFGKLLYRRAPSIIHPDQLRRLTQGVSEAGHNETFFSH